MSTDAITSITEAEDASRTAIALARQNARKKIADAEIACSELVGKSVSRAQDEVRALFDAADKKAAENAEELDGTIANRCAALRAHAEARLDSAASLILERIVKS